MKAPLLVMPGTADPVSPIAPGMARAEAGAGAELVRRDGGGHALHRADWATLIGASVGHTALKGKRNHRQ